MRHCIVLITVALSSIFVLLGIHDLVAIGSSTSERFTHASAISFDARAPQLDARQSRPDAAAILARNVFDPSGASSARGRPTNPATVPATDPPQAPTPELPCESELRIAGTFYNGKHPERSQVVLRGPNARGRAYASGMVLGDYTLEQVHPRAVRLRGANGACWLGMFTNRSREKIAREQATRERHKKTEVAKAARKRRHARADARRSVFTRAELQAGVQQVDSTRFVLRRDFVDEALTRISKIARANRFSTVRKGARIRGVRIDGLPSKGLLPRVGLERGDVLTTLNGYALGNPKEMMEVYANLGRAGRLTLVVQRGPNTLMFDYRIQ